MAPHEISLKDLREHYQKAGSSKGVLSTTTPCGALKNGTSTSTSSLIPVGVPITTTIPISVVPSQPGSQLEKEADCLSVEPISVEPILNMSPSTPPGDQDKATAEIKTRAVGLSLIVTFKVDAKQASGGVALGTDVTSPVLIR
ncbi:hypothetical protein RJT34_02299 [Clitoria ternatea]|uniref:Uncharacterized protein n=1 Tax=Clitoria ternatea TaxID=43366 RepID=A0AAN9PYX5_CLITE